MTAAFLIVMLPSLVLAQHQMSNMAMSSAWMVEGQRLMFSSLY